LLKYAPVIDVTLDNQVINFADAETDGHRVKVDIDLTALNLACTWSRAVNSDRPLGAISPAGFATAVQTALGNAYSDMDGSATGLSFTNTFILNDENRSDSANDLVMSYVLYKVYGLTSKDTRGKVYNATDALGMLTNATVADAVEGSLGEEENTARNGPVDKMFRDLLTADPARYFNSDGKQIPGLFETNADAAGNGYWNLVDGDVIELKLNFIFAANVTRRVVSAQQQPLDAQGGAANPAEEATEEIVIASGDEFKVRLQLVAKA
jgi:hypothetical protein